MDARTGDLSVRGADRLLRDLATRRATGRLLLTSGGLTARIWLRDGAVYTASAPEARARLGDRLVGAGLLAQHQLDEALDLQRRLSERRRLGELLVEQGHIDRETLRSYVTEQITDSVAATLGWRRGTWSFERDLETDEDVPLRASVENLLMDATRRFEEWEVVLDTLGSLDAVVDFVPRSDGADLALTPDEWSLLTCIDGVASVADIADVSGYGQLETARIVYGLVTAGIVQVIGVGDGAGEPPEEPQAHGAAEQRGAGEEPAPAGSEAGRGSAGEEPAPAGSEAEQPSADGRPPAPAGSEAEQGDREAATAGDDPAAPPRPRPSARSGTTGRDALLAELAALDDDESAGGPAVGGGEAGRPRPRPGSKGSDADDAGRRRGRFRRRS